jgi:hypothetical protein
MTTVVINNNTVYADGQSTSTMITSYNVKKIVNIGKAIIVGAGRYSHVVKFHEWATDMIEAGHAQEAFPHVAIGMPEKMVDEDFLGAVLYPDGVVVLFEGCDNYYEVEQPVFLGSGGDYAAGAIHSGADGVTAIEVAIKLDPFTGGEIQVESFEEELEPLSREDLEIMSKEDILDTLFGTLEDSTSTDDIETTQDILILKAAADSLDIKYPHNIKLETLRNKILKFLED